jgi:hypothetical protein
MNKVVQQDQELIIDVVHAEYQRGHVLRITFSDGLERVIDFEPFLQSAKNPMTRKYLDMNAFKQFSIEYGNVTWNEDELCFPTMDLYEGTL